MVARYYCRGLTAMEASSPWDATGLPAPVDLRTEIVTPDRQRQCNEAAAIAIAAGVELPAGDYCILDWLQGQQQGRSAGGEA